MNNNLTIYCDGIPYPEGPVFDAKGNLFVCARRGGYIVRRAAGGTLSHFVETDGKPNGLEIDAKGQLLIADATRQQILTCTRRGELTTLIDTQTDGHSLLGPNDLCVDHKGMLYFTDPGLEMHAPQGAIYRWDVQARVLQCLASDLAFPNGLAIDHDSTRLYFVETSSGRLSVIELAESQNNPSAVIAELGQGANPDGMTWFDADHLLITLHGYGQLAIVNTTDGNITRFEIGKDCHPTNVTLRDGMIYITEDTHQAVLLLPKDVLIKQLNESLNRDH